MCSYKSRIGILISVLTVFSVAEIDKSKLKFRMGISTYGDLSNQAFR